MPPTAIPTGVPPRAGLLPDPAAHAERIAAAVARVWTAEHGHHAHDIPLAVVAGLAIAGQADPAGAVLADEFARLDPPAMCRLLDRTWTLIGVMRPDLTPRLEHLLGWLRDARGGQQRAAHAVAVAVLRERILHWGVDSDRRHAVDLLGLVLQRLRGEQHTHAGQVYTPAGVCEAMARMLIPAPPQPGQWIGEPAAGTGGMVRAAAQVVRQHGGDPADLVWAACDIDPLAAGCLAANAILWDLGPNVVIACANALTSDWEATAVRERAEAIRRFRTYRLVAACQALTSPRPAAAAAVPVGPPRRRVPRRGPLTSAGGGP